MNAHAVFLLMLVVLTACSDKQSANMPAAKTEVRFGEFIGHWEVKNTVAGDAGNFDNTALIIKKDGTVEYKHCSRGANSAVTQSSGEALSNLVVGDIGNGLLSLAKPTTPYYAEKKFRMDREPYQEGGRWYIELDGIKLRKLEDGETSDYASWQCPA